MKPYGCTSYGEFGPNTSAKSHEYALAQGLDAASYAVAVLPSTMEEACRANSRLHTLIHLPRSTFHAEGANVDTLVAFFDRSPVAKVATLALGESDRWPALPLSAPLPRDGAPVFNLEGIDASVPAITTPVTGDTRVELHHRRRMLRLKFQCGLTEAKVLNGLLLADVDKSAGHRYPKDIAYVGSGRFYLDAHLAQGDPQAALSGLIEDIRRLGGSPWLSPTLRGYFDSLVRKHQRAIAPFRKVVKRYDQGVVTLVANRSAMLKPGDFKSPPIKRDTRLTARVVDAEYAIEHEGYQVTLRKDEVLKRFSIVDDGISGAAQWTVVHEGLAVSHPKQFQSALARIDAAGIDWLWPYQRYSLAELLVKPYGSVAGWMQGTGKARLALALALVSGKGLISVESGLIPEMLREVMKLGLGDKVKVLRSPSDTQDMKAINLVSYHALRQRHGKRTLASFLRRRINTLISDEGSLLRNDYSQQSRAVAEVAAQRLYVLDGTPIANLPRDLLPLAAITTGHGVAHQRYGINDNLYLHPRLLESANLASRGVAAFADKHVVLEWVTNQFKDSNLRTGAKREIPKLRNVGEFRDWTASFVQRRVRQEPDVAPYAGCPDPTYASYNVHWDEGHLKHYLDTCIEFANHYRQHKAEQEAKGAGINLTLILARIQAVQRAASCPHAPGKNAVGSFSGITSKQRFVVGRAMHHVAAGRKTIVYAATPAAVERLVQLLRKEGLKVVAFHGGVTIKKRTQALDDEFRFGDAEVLVSSWVGQKGLNIPQAKAIVFYDRDWQSSTEEQAEARTQRPDQEDSVIIEHCHLRGSIDEYMAQMQRFKRAAADAGLDWGEGMDSDEEFAHLDTILGRFVQDVFNLSTSETREMLNAA